MGEKVLLRRRCCNQHPRCPTMSLASWIIILFVSHIIPRCVWGFPVEIRYVTHEETEVWGGWNVHYTHEIDWRKDMMIFLQKLSSKPLWYHLKWKHSYLYNAEYKRKTNFTSLLTIPIPIVKKSFCFWSLQLPSC